MSVDHYENFPVASWLMPAALRPAVQAVYAFARSADDFADAGSLSPGERLTRLAAYEQGLVAIRGGLMPLDPVMARLARVLGEHPLPLAPFHDLLSAFRQDVLVTRYPDRRALLDYCQRSANPVGRILLSLWRQDDPALLAASDAICTALQLVNFLQDVAVDAGIPRLYLPLDALARHGLTAEQVLALRPGAGAHTPAALRRLILEECAWTRRLMLSGAWLPARLGGRIGLELGLVVAGGLRILERIEAVEGEVAARRPVLRLSDWPRLAWRAWLVGFPPAGAN